MNDSTDSLRAKTPWHLWLVGGLGAPWNLIGCVDFIMTMTRNEMWMASFNKEQLASKGVLN